MPPTLAFTAALCDETARETLNPPLPPPPPMLCAKMPCESRPSVEMVAPLFQDHRATAARGAAAAAHAEADRGRGGNAAVDAEPAVTAAAAHALGEDAEGPVAGRVDGPGDRVEISDRDIAAVAAPAAAAADAGPDTRALCTETLPETLKPPSPPPLDERTPPHPLRPG